MVDLRRCSKGDEKREGKDEENATKEALQGGFASSWSFFFCIKALLRKTDTSNDI